MRRLLSALVCGLLTVGFLLTSSAPAQAQKVWDTPLPRIVRVAIRESPPGGAPDPRGRIIWVKTVLFQDYIKNVLPVEWYPSWHPEALKAGAIAVKMFAWYHDLNPVTMDGFTFDVDNSTNFQVYREGHRANTTDLAVDQTLYRAYVQSDGTIFELNYRAGKKDDPNWQYRNAQKMSQWGSEYWAARGKTDLEILQFYYLGRILVPVGQRRG